MSNLNSHVYLLGVRPNSPVALNSIEGQLRLDQGQDIVFTPAAQLDKGLTVRLADIHLADFSQVFSGGARLNITCNDGNSYLFSFDHTFKPQYILRTLFPTTTYTDTMLQGSLPEYIDWINGLRAVLPAGAIKTPGARGFWNVVTGIAIGIGIIILVLILLNWFINRQ